MVWFNMDAIPKSDIKFDIRFGNRFDIRVKQMTRIGHETTSFFSQFTIFILLAQNYITILQNLAISPIVKITTITNFQMPIS